MEQNQMPFFEGVKTTITLPSSRKVTVRETNAADDEVLSTTSDLKDSTGMIKFLAAIVEFDDVLQRKPLAGDILNYHINDQLYLMFKQRLINKGTELKFKFFCDNETCIKKPGQEYVEDLSLIDGELANDQYVAGRNQIMRYPLGIAIMDEFKTSSGRSYQYEIMTGVHDKKKLDLSPTAYSKNTMLTLRNLKHYQGGEWVTINHFGFMPSKEASEIRKRVLINDPDFNPIITGNCGYCDKPFLMTLFSMTDFFWPGETM